MDAVKAVSLAQRLINKNGRKIEVQRLSSKAADTNKPWRGPGVPTIEKRYKTKGAFVAVYGRTNLGSMGITPELLLRVDEVVLVAGGLEDLETYHQILDGTQTWRIESINKLKPGDTSILYAFGLCR